MSTQPHVCHVITGLQIGGAERIVVDLVKVLRDRIRFTVCYFAPGPYERVLQELGVRTVRILARSRVDPRALLQLVQLLREDRPHVVHTHLIQADLYGRVAAYLAGVPAIVSTAHNLEAWRDRKLIAMLDRCTSRLAHRIVAVSQRVKEDLLARNVVDPSRLCIIPNGIDPTQFTDPRVAPLVELEALRRQGYYLVGTVGRFHPQKGHSYLIEAAVEVLSVAPHVRFVLVGDGPLKASLIELMERKGVRFAFILMGVRRDIDRVLASLDAFVLPSLYEGLPLACLEAMAAGLPVAATAVGGIPEVVRHEETGLLVPPGDPQKLAEAVIQLERDRGLAARLARQARKLILDEYSIEKTADRTLALYRELLPTVF